KKIRSHKKLKENLINDFKAILIQKTSCFVLPAVQRSPLVKLPEAKFERKQPRKCSTFNNQIALRIFDMPTEKGNLPTHKIYLVANKDMFYFYRNASESYGCCGAYHMPFVSVYTDLLK